MATSRDGMAPPFFLFVDERVESERYWWDERRWRNDRFLPGDPPHVGSIRTVPVAANNSAAERESDWRAGPWRYGFDFGSTDKKEKTAMTFARQRTWRRVFCARPQQLPPPPPLPRAEAVDVSNRTDMDVALWAFVRAPADFHPNLWLRDGDAPRALVRIGADARVECCADRDAACLIALPFRRRRPSPPPPRVSCEPAGASVTEALHRTVGLLRTRVYVVARPWTDGAALRVVGSTQYQVQFSRVGDRIREWAAEASSSSSDDDDDEKEDDDNRAERAYVSRRLADVCAPALRAFCGGGEPKRIAVCFSGGGLRATTFALGFQEGLADIGFADCVLYRAGVSGGAWALSMLSTGGTSASERADSMQASVQTLPWPELAAQDVLKRVRQLEAFKPRHTLTAADAYGAAITAHWARDLLDVCISRQLPRDVSVPFPIYNAVRDTAERGHLEWVEVTPTRVRLVPGPRSTTTRSVPTRTFGRRSRNSRAPEPCAAFLNGTFGSAFCASGAEMEKTVGGAGAKLLRALGLKNKRFFSPAVYYDSFSREDEDSELRLLDAGVCCNASLPSFVCAPHRQDVDFVIVVDARPTDPDPSVSKDVLTAFREYVGGEDAYPYAGGVSVELPICVIRPKEEVGAAPTLIYAGLAKQDDFDPAFDPATVSFMKFALSEADFARLRGLGRHTARKLEDTLKRELSQ